MNVIVFDHIEWYKYPIFHGNVNGKIGIGNWKLDWIGNENWKWLGIGYWDLEMDLPIEFKLSLRQIIHKLNRFQCQNVLRNIKVYGIDRSFIFDQRMYGVNYYFFTPIITKMKVYCLLILITVSFYYILLTCIDVSNELKMVHSKLFLFSFFLYKI